MNKLSTADRVQVVRCLVEGNSVRATVRMTGVAKNTIAKLLADLGCACADFHNRAVRNLPTTRIQCDEIWSFVGAKQKNTTEATREQGWGDVWTWTAIDADHKLCVAWLVGGRDASYAYSFLSDVAGRLTKRVQLTTDGHNAYLHGVLAFDGNVDYAMLIKKYGQERPGEARYSPAKCIGCDKEPRQGNPDADHISTSFVERQNLTMRMSIRRMTRLTNAHSKKVENHAHAIALHFVHYNFCRKHETLKKTPAMAAGIADHVWSVEELVGLLDKAVSN